MLIPTTDFVKKIFILLISFVFIYELQSQCNPPDQLPTGDCSTAPLTCLNDACYETQQNFGGPPYNGWCGNNTAIHNPQYFQFIATSPNVEIHIHVDACDSGGGLQSALLDTCPWDLADVLDCDNGSGGGVGQTMILTYNNMQVDSTYYLLIDGNAGALCQYTINFVSGIYTPGIVGELDPDESEAIPGVVCQGYDDFMMVTGPSIEFAHGYYWVLGWSGDTITSTLPMNTIDIPNDAPPGIWEICARAFSGCDTTDEEVCFEVEIVEVEDVEKEPATYCPEEFPFLWHNVNITGPGTYMKSFDNEDGCPYDSIWNVEEYPEVPVGEIEIVHCYDENFDPFMYEGEIYDNSGTYDLFYPGAGLNGCDSTAELDLTLIGIDAFIELECENGEFKLIAVIQEVIPSNADLEFEWYEGNGDLIFDNNPLLVLEGGQYELIIKVITPQGTCEYFYNYAFDADFYKPDAPVFGHGDTVICAQENVIFEVIEDPFMDPVTYIWSGPPNVTIYEDGSNIVNMDFTFSTGGQVCVFAENECGDGPTTCFNVEILPAPNAAFSYEPEVCVDSITLVSFTGDASNNAEFIWNFDGATIHTGTGEGPYELSWNIPGDKTITLQVIEPGCDTSSVSQTVVVSNLLAPTINCSSTISSVTFDWTDVAGASGYLVSINNGAAVPVNSSDTTLTSLTPGTVVNLTLTVVSAGACDDIVLTSSCTAQNCPPPTITLSGQDSFCLNSPTVVNLNAEVNGNPGTGTWAGPGITDPVAGTFDPQVAGVGQHQLMYTVDVNGCPFTEPFLVTVFDSITADFTVDPLICIDDVANVTYTGNATGSATFMYDFGTASVVSGSGPGPYQIEYGTPGQKTVRLQISDNGCISEVVSHTIDVAPAINPPVVNCMANTSSVEFSWPDEGITYTVNTLSAQSGTQTGTSILFGGLVPGDIVQIEIISDNGGPCPFRRDTFDCEARLCPTPTITITPVNDICLYPGTPTVAMQVDVQNGNGVGDWSGPGITNTVTGIFDPNIAGSGAHPVTYHYLDDGCDFVESTTINVFDPPIAFISNTDLVLTCAGGNILFLDGSGSTGNALIYEWSTDNGFIISGEDTDEAEVGAPGTYQLKVTSADGCVDSTEVTVTQDANTPVASAGPDRVLTCDSTSFTLGGGSSTGVNIVYAWSTPDGNITGPANLIRADIDATGSYTILVRDTVNGCQSADLAIVTIDTAVASIVLTPGDTIDCNTPVSTVSSMLGGPVSDFILSWSTPDGSIQGSTNTPQINVTQGGTYTLTIEDIVNGCTRSASAAVGESDEIIDDVDVSAMNIRCYGEDNGALVINSVTGGNPPYTYQWSVSPQGGDSLSLLAPGTYSLTVTDANGCSFTKVFTLTEPQLLTVDVGPNQIVAAEDSVKIDLTTNIAPGAIGDITWTGYDGLDCPGCPSLEFIASTSATFTAFLTDTAGCTASDSMRLTVMVPRIIYVPTIFSPNDDGLNDFFTISGRRNLINIAYLRIYDRWGNVIFDKSDLTPGVEEEGWDGMFDGKPVLPGVYVYVAKLDYEDISETIKGGITVVR